MGLDQVRLLSLKGARGYLLGWGSWKCLSRYILHVMFHIAFSSKTFSTYFTFITYAKVTCCLMQHLLQNRFPHRPHLYLLFLCFVSFQTENFIFSIQFCVLIAPEKPMISDEMESPVVWRSICELLVNLTCSRHSRSRHPRGRGEVLLRGKCGWTRCFLKLEYEIQNFWKSFRKSSVYI